MESKLSPQFFGQPEMTAQDFFHSDVINSEVVGERFQFVHSSRVGVIGALVDHKDGIRSGLAGMGSQLSKGSGRSDLSSILENDFDR